ncbi:DUF4430 domain-containing protein [Candidatus Parcubacteria bacterium]|nr:DUF4430 domain-containing protein [Candidatus Parcubacteria bacterium]
MKKLLSTMLIVSLLSSLFPSLETNAIYDTNTAQDYLIANSANPWSTMALAVLGSASIFTDHLISINGTSAIDYAAPILAITAINQNPRVFPSTDYVAALKSYYTGNQIGDSAMLNDDCFGILALISAGESFDDAVIVDSKNFIFSHQNNDGGWGFSVTANSDTNMTAAAILALISAGVDNSDSYIQNALSFLQVSQNDDGGFPYYPNSNSDSSSTAWVIWALNVLNISPDSLVKFDNTPVSYLESNQSDQGFFKYQNNSSGEDSFSAMTTAYAVIALQNKKLPVNIVANNTSAEKFSFRIEGSEETICLGEVAGPTVLDIIKNAKSICGFTYEIKDTDWGFYLNRINNDEAKGELGWLYLINDTVSFIGAADYELQSSDSVLWYYGGFDWQPTKLSLSAEQVDTSQSVTATVEIFSDNSWLPLAGASVYFGADTIITNTNGQVGISLQDGFYKIHAQKEGYVRSNSILLKVGQGASSSVDLTVTIENGDVEGDSTNEDTISFVVDTSNLDFGNLSSGSSATKNITLNNNGTSDIHIEALVSGDSLFTENLDLNSVSWKNFETDIARDGSQDVDVKLSIPANYSDGNGAKSAQLTFWAIAQ